MLAFCYIFFFWEQKKLIEYKAHSAPWKKVNKQNKVRFSLFIDINLHGLFKAKAIFVGQ